LVFGRNTFSLNLYNFSLKLTSATVASATSNSMPVVTFCLALLLRLEVVKLRSSSGIAKLAGVSLCLAGVFAIAFYAGPALSPVNHHRAFAAHAASTSRRVTWIKGTFFMVLSNATWSLWIVMQAGLLKEYPNKMLVTVTQCVFSALQSLIVAVVAERDFSRWKLRLDVSLLAIIYTVSSN
jgi:drug/metabolite transporter (DMT)-like permease